MKIIVTGGAGFIGSAMVRFLIKQTNHEVLNIDKLTYAANIHALSEIMPHAHYHFLKADISDAIAMQDAFSTFQPDAIIHLAAESHVDRSIEQATPFIQTNIVGTFTLLETARYYLKTLPEEKKLSFRFLHVSTDEVYGELPESGFFTEKTAYSPRSPYAASKASSDLLVNAYFHTHHLPTLRTNCSNNIGEFQYPEKLIPIVIFNALNQKRIPIYGDGQNIRDWIDVNDHVRALYCVLQQGQIGESYNIGANHEMSNLQLVHKICSILDQLHPNKTPYADQIIFVPDRKGHDFRYAIDASKIKKHLAWEAKNTFDQTLERTVKFYFKSWLNS